MPVVILILVLIGLILLALTAFGVAHPRINLLAAGLFCWLLAWALAGPLVAFPSK